MEVKPGYKQTEVGIIPEEWEVISIGEVVTDFRGGAPLKPSDFTKSGIKVLPKGGVGRSGWLKIDDADLQYCSSSYAASHRNNQVDESFTIAVLRDLVPSGPSIGLIVRIKEPETFVLAQGVYGFRVNQSADSRYLVQLSNTRWYRQLMNSIMVGSTQVHITNTAFKLAKIPLPPLPEQRAIAEALSDVDGLLGGLDRLIAKKRDLKQAAMQQLLTGQTRLPGFHGEWEVKTLFELAARKKELFDDGDWIESEHITTEGIRLIQTGNIGVGNFVEKDDKKYINEASFTSLRCKQLKQGDLLVCRLADPAGRACVLGDIGEERIVTSVDVTIFRPPSELADRHFLSQVFSTTDWFRAVSDRSGGTTHKRISRGALGRLSITLPPVPEQSAIAGVLSEMDGELAKLEQRREKTRALKQALMQELLTGRTRLV